MSPMPVDNLTPESPEQSIRDAISASIAQCMKEGGKEMKQCAAIAYSAARKNTGKSLQAGSQR